MIPNLTSLSVLSFFCHGDIAVSMINFFHHKSKWEPKADLFSHKGPDETFSLVVRWSHQLFSAVSYLHKLGITHNRLYGELWAGLYVVFVGLYGWMREAVNYALITIMEQLLLIVTTVFAANTITKTTCVDCIHSVCYCEWNQRHKLSLPFVFIVLPGNCVRVHRKTSYALAEDFEVKISCFLENSDISKDVKCRYRSPKTLEVAL